MEIDQEHKSQIEELISRMECPKDFECYKSGSENLPKAKIVVDDKLVTYLQPKQKPCKFGIDFGYGIFCECPLRNYVARNIHI